MYDTLLVIFAIVWFIGGFIGGWIYKLPKENPTAEEQRDWVWILVNTLAGPYVIYDAIKHNKELKKKKDDRDK